jgi:hypothetical protein
MQLLWCIQIAPFFEQYDPESRDCMRFASFLQIFVEFLLHAVIATPGSLALFGFGFALNLLRSGEREAIDKSS